MDQALVVAVMSVEMRSKQGAMALVHEDVAMADVRKLRLAAMDLGRATAMIVADVEKVTSAAM